MSVMTALMVGVNHTNVKPTEEGHEALMGVQFPPMFWSCLCFPELPWVDGVWTAVFPLLWLCTDCFQGLRVGPPYCYVANYKLEITETGSVWLHLIKSNHRMRWKRAL